LQEVQRRALAGQNRANATRELSDGFTFANLFSVVFPRPPLEIYVKLPEYLFRHGQPGYHARLFGQDDAASPSVFREKRRRKIAAPDVFFECALDDRANTLV
jgi:hypothetical protein